MVGLFSIKAKGLCGDWTLDPRALELPLFFFLFTPVSSSLEMVGRLGRRSLVNRDLFLTSYGFIRGTKSYHSRRMTPMRE